MSDSVLATATAQVQAAQSSVPVIKAFFDEPTFTVSYVVHDPETRRAAIIDSMLDYDPASGRISFSSAEHIMMRCSAVNAMDASALESIEAINHRLADAGVNLHLSEVKGPVMDALERSHLLRDLTGQVLLSQNAAFSTVMASADSEDEARAPSDLWLAKGLI